MTALIDKDSGGVSQVTLAPDWSKPSLEFPMFAQQAALAAYARASVLFEDPAYRAAADLCGYILKKDSPSCGMTRVKVYDSDGPPTRSGVGIFARALLAHAPHLPVEEEGRLEDARLRENFIERVFAFRRLRDLFESRWTVGDVVRFHTGHKLVLLSHSTQAYTRLGRLVAGAKAADRAALRTQYTAGFMDALSAIATPKRHASARASRRKAPCSIRRT